MKGQDEQGRRAKAFAVSVQEEERSRLARELHDSVVQDMRQVLLLANGISDPELAAKITEVQKKCIRDLRNICYKLSPPDRELYPFTNALTSLCKTVQKNSAVEVRLVVMPGVDFLQWNKEDLLNIYRIIQEALNNIVRHAQAHEAAVLVKTNEIVVSDDGKGFDPEAAEQAAVQEDRDFHFGISNMKLRASLLDARLSFRSEKDCGTSLYIRFNSENTDIPKNKEA